MSDKLLAEYPVKVTNLDKILWPQVSITKADYIDYMAKMSSVMLPHLQDRPLTVVRYPHGVDGDSFYQKNAPKDTPKWVETYAVYSNDSHRHIHYILANSTACLIWLANQACIELHPWYSTIYFPEHPTNIAFDLDPSVPGFEKVRQVAFYLKELLDTLGIPSYPKTSGATGLQVFVPIADGFTYDQTREITYFIARYMETQHPELVTIERTVKNRGDKVYFDFLQHAQHKTLVAPYSPRPVPDARVSAPVTWDELEKGAKPEDFTIRTMLDRVRIKGDLFSPMEKPGIDISDILSFIRRHSSS